MRKGYTARGKELFDTRRKSGLSQEAVAKALGVTRLTYNRIERDPVNRATVAQMERIQEAIKEARDA